jgi:hypothetical protein
MAGRPGFFGGFRDSEAPERDVEGGVGPDALVGDRPFARFGDPNAPRSDNDIGNSPGFDPVWGTLGAASAQGHDDWLSQGPAEVPEGLAVDAEIFGSGFQISGQIHTGQFDRLSDWINMQTGFIQIHDAWHAHLGQIKAPDPDQRKGTLWVRLNQVVLVAERSPVRQTRPGAPVVQKERRKVSIVTPGYNLLGSIHVHAYGSMGQFLESPDTLFMPITDLTVRWLDDPAMAARFPFAMVNREQLVTVLDESQPPTGDTERRREAEREDDTPLDRRFGAA